MLSSKFSFLEEFGILLTNDSAHNVYVGPTEHCQSHHYGHWRDGGCAGYEVPEKAWYRLWSVRTERAFLQNTLSERLELDLYPGPYERLSLCSLVLHCDGISNSI
jgi:hypothetical protein